MISPCKDCPVRAIGCKLSCEKWLKYEAIRNADYEKRKKYSECVSYTAGKSNEKIHRRYRSKRR